MENQNLEVAEMPIIDSVSNTSVSSTDNGHIAPPQEPITAATIQAWLVSYLAEMLEIEPDEVDITLDFNDYGLDSSAAVGITGDLEEWLKQELAPTLLYDYPSVESLAQHLANELKGEA
ncbi:MULTISPECIES: acyl carrier protein [unclassified Moorena]|uniref:acyl carrier protein n=1 Tax=unclassified Moorena TaxID=2683338 RepID=UPI0025DBEE59|nr:MULTISPECIES: acyl carrier protein [unclassified Moorena]